MEKYNKFIDPLTGINPFLQPKHTKVTFLIFIKAIFMLPLWFLYKISLVKIDKFIKVTFKGTKNLFKKINVNSVTRFDKEIVDICCIYTGFLTFPEKTQTNNKGILNYSEDSDYVVGLKYSSECIYMNQSSYIKWLIIFLGSDKHVYVTAERGNDLSKVTNLPKLTLNYKDKQKFNEIFYK